MISKQHQKVLRWFLAAQRPMDGQTRYTAVVSAADHDADVTGPISKGFVATYLSIFAEDDFIPRQSMCSQMSHPSH